jgi:hypothetical protein
MSDYRDDRAALRSRNEELETSLAERERELADLRERVAPEPALPPKRVDVPVPTGQIPDWKRPAAIGFSLLILVVLVGISSSAKGAFGLSRSAALGATLLVAVVSMLIVGWPRKT